MKQFLYTLYFICIAAPLFLLATLLCALVSGLGSAFFSQRIFSYYPGKWWSKLTLFIFLTPIKVEGKENIEKDKGYIVIANHQSALDIFMLYGYMDLPFRWILKGALRKVPFVGWACQKCGFIFVDNSSAKAASQTVNAAEQAVQAGYSIFIFPEGSRSSTGKIQRLKKGAFKIAMDTDATLLPVGISGAYKALPKGSYLPRPHRLTLRIGKPFETSEYEKTPKGLVTLSVKGAEEIKKRLDADCI